jgi:hypothetical protein
VKDELKTIRGLFLKKNVSQDSRSPGRDLNTRRPEYETEVLTTQTRRLVFGFKPIKHINKFVKESH